MLKKDRLDVAKFYLPFAAMTVFLLFIYSMDFPQGDDFYFTVAGGSMERIWRFYISYYLNSGSRMANMLAQVFLISGLKVWKAVTPFVIESISLLMYYYVTGSLALRDGKSGDAALACVCAAFPGLVPVAQHVFADTFVWMDGSCNYIYPMLLALLGFVPFYNMLCGRPVPRAMRFISPACLLASALLHEQAAMLIAAVCAVCLIYFKRDKCLTKYEAAVSCLAFAALLFTLTAPGAYVRLRRTANADVPVLLRLAGNLLTYFYPFTSECWPLTALTGACALFVMRGRRNGAAPVSYFAVIFGTLVFSLSGMFMYPGIKPDPFMGGGMFGFKNILGCAECILIIIYFIFIFCIFISAAKNEKKYRPAAAIYTGMWASQAIPAALGVKGRPLFYLVVMLLLMALNLFWGAGHRLGTALKYAVAAFAVFTLVSGIQPMRSNMAEYAKIERGMAAAREGRAEEVVIDRDRFNFYYAYYNAFSPRYDRSLHMYYDIPDSVKIIFVHG